MDGPLAQLLPAWIDLYNRQYHDRLTPGHIVNYDVAQFTRDDCGHDVYKLLAKKALFADLIPTSGALAGIRELYEDGFSLIAVTTLPPQSVNAVFAAAEKRQWLVNHCHPFIENMIMMNSDYCRHIIAGDVLIDDHIDNVMRWAETGRWAVLFDAPHNRSFVIRRELKVLKAVDWKEVVTHVRFVHGVIEEGKRARGWTESLWTELARRALEEKNGYMKAEKEMPLLKEDAR